MEPLDKSKESKEKLKNTAGIDAAEPDLSSMPSTSGWGDVKVEDKEPTREEIVEMQKNQKRMYLQRALQDPRLRHMDRKMITN